MSVPSGKGGGDKRKDASSWPTNCGRRTAASRLRIQSSTGWLRMASCRAMRSRVPSENAQVAG
eukprot:2849892-Prymnesium_polylepis.1